VDLALKALVEPRRRAILRLVRDQELSSGAIASQFDVTGPAISQHLGVLREAGLVVERRAGTRRLYRARPEGLRDLRRFVEDFWDDGLDRLRTVAEETQREKDRNPRDKEQTHG
jgi:DNA-binding transcriptional ArsR family regulator